jgi:hypothetical protein
MDEGVWEAARSVRPYLSELVGADAPAMDTALADVLNSDRHSELGEQQLTVLLESHSGTRLFLRRVLGDELHRPPRVAALETTRYISPAGDPVPPAPDKFRCPHGDIVWYRPEVGVPIERCPTHGCLLVRVDREADAD